MTTKRTFWKALDAKTRMSPFVASRNKNLAIQFPVGVKVTPVCGRVYASTSQRACQHWALFAEEAFMLDPIIVVPAEVEDPIRNPPLMYLLDFVKMDTERIKLAWSISDEIRGILKERPYAEEDESELISRKLSQKNLRIKPSWIRYGTNCKYVACKSLTCIE